MSPLLTDITLSSRIRALIYGISKSGKTYGAGTFPRPNFISFDENGINTLVGRDFLSAYPNQISQIRYEIFREADRNRAGVVNKHNAFDDATRYIDECMKKEGKWNGARVSTDDFDTWVCDSGTTLSEASMNKAIILLGGKSLSIASQTHAQALSTGLVYAKQQDYGSERSMTEQFIQKLLDTDKHVLLLCHEKEDYDDKGTTTAIKPLLTGQSVERVCLKFDEIWRLTKRKQGETYIRELNTIGSNIIKGGSRYGIVTGTPWSYDSVLTQLNSIHSLQLSALARKD